MIDDVADRVDVRYVGAVLVVHRDCALIVQRDAHLLKSEASHVRRASGCVEHEVRFDCAAIPEYDASRATRCQFDAYDARVELQIDVLFPQLIGDERAHAVVEPAQEQFASVQQRRGRTESVEDAGKLHGDVAAADDDHPLRKFAADRTLRST